VVARWQLLEAGVTARQIVRRLHNGRLHEIHRGVYLVGHTIAPRYAPEMAALLACGPSATLSHKTAGALWNLIPHPAPGDVHVTIPPERTAARPRIKIHRARLDSRDVRHRHRLALTSPPRTILDMAATVDLGELERLMAEAQYRHLASEAELRSQLHRNPGKRGTATLRHVLDLPGGPRCTRSPAERGMLRLLRAAEITGYEANVRIHGYEVDFLWRDRGLVVEVDGYDAHSGRIAFERDRLKVAKLNAHGITVMPITGRQIRDDPRGVLDRLLAALA
jgi:very-short-patch-repair endonuclease